MSTGNQNWDWLIQICLREKFRFLGGKDGEPWIEYRVLLYLQPDQYEESTIERKCIGLRRHPVFTGLIKMTDLEGVGGGKEKSKAKS